MVVARSCGPGGLFKADLLSKKSDSYFCDLSAVTMRGRRGESAALGRDEDRPNWVGSSPLKTRYIQSGLTGLTEVQCLRGIYHLRTRSSIVRL